MKPGLAVAVIETEPPAGILPLTRPGVLRVPPPTGLLVILSRQPGVPKVIWADRGTPAVPAALATHLSRALGLVGTGATLVQTLLMHFWKAVVR